MHNFPANNRAALISRCISKGAERPKRNATPDQVRHRIFIFLDQFTCTLEASSEIDLSAAAHGKGLRDLGYSVDQVVHDDGGLCHAITDLAVERDAPFSIDEFRTLNRCLDNAIADAVTELSFQRDTAIAEQQSFDINERLGFLMHELRNAITSTGLADAIQIGISRQGERPGAF